MTAPAVTVPLDCGALPAPGERAVAKLRVSQPAMNSGKRFFIGSLGVVIRRLFRYSWLLRRTQRICKTRLPRITRLVEIKTCRTLRPTLSGRRGTFYSNTATTIEQLTGDSNGRHLTSSTGRSIGSTFL